jgi:hypothetical protein
LPSSTNKKVQIRRFDRDPLSGFVNPATYLGKDGLEFLNLAGSVIVIPYQDVKAVHFVKDFPAADAAPDRRTFLTRPKMDGLWVRVRFRDLEMLEGVVTNNLLAFDGIGFTLIPPDSSYGNQRLFIPRTALLEIQVLGVVGSPLRPKRKSQAREQIELFEP